VSVLVADDFNGRQLIAEALLKVVRRVRSGKRIANVGLVFDRPVVDDTKPGDTHQRLKYGLEETFTLKILYWDRE